MLSHEDMTRIEREERRVIEEDAYREQVRRKVSQELRDQEEAARQQAILDRERRENEEFWRRFKRNCIIAGALIFFLFCFVATR